MEDGCAEAHVQSTPKFGTQHINAGESALPAATGHPRLSRLRGRALAGSPMSSRYRRGGENIGHRDYAGDYEHNPSYIGANGAEGDPNDVLLDTGDYGPPPPRRSKGPPAWLQWTSFAFTITLFVLTIVTMIFGIMSKNQIDTVNTNVNDVEVATTILTGDVKRYFNNDVLIKATHGSTFFEGDVPSLDDQEYVTSYIQEILYPHGTVLKIQKAVYAVEPTYAGSDGLFSMKEVTKGFCTWTYLQGQTTDGGFDHLTIDPDAVFGMDGKMTWTPCVYDWPPQNGLNATTSNYMIAITVFIDGTPMKQTDFKQSFVDDILYAQPSNGPVVSPKPVQPSYSIPLLTHIVNERITFAKSPKPVSLMTYTMAELVQEFIPYGRVYGYGETDITFQAGNNAAQTVQYFSFDSVGTPVTFPNAVIMSLMNSAFSTSGLSVATTLSMTASSPYKDGIYPADHKPSVMTFPAGDTNIPQAQFQSSFFKLAETGGSILYSDLVKTSYTANPIFSGMGSSGLYIYPFGTFFATDSANDDPYPYVKVTKSTPDGLSFAPSDPVQITQGVSVYKHVKFSDSFQNTYRTPAYALSISTVQTRENKDAVSGVVLDFNISVVPDFSYTKGVGTPSGNQFSDYVQMSDVAKKMLLNEKKTLLFEFKVVSTATGSGTCAVSDYFKYVIVGPTSFSSATTSLLIQYLTPDTTANATNIIKNSNLATFSPQNPLTTSPTTFLTTGTVSGTAAASGSCGTGTATTTMTVYDITGTSSAVSALVTNANGIATPKMFENIAL